MARPRTPAATYRKILLRIPEELLELAKVRALAEDRSLNAQLLQYIRHGLEPAAPVQASRKKKSS